MKKHFLFNLNYCLGIILFSTIFLACSESEEPAQELIEDSVYFELTLDGVKYRSEILEENLIPGSGFEKKTDNSPGLNIMQYTFYSNVLTLMYSINCGTMENKDCLNTNIWIYDDLKEGSYTYPKVFTQSFEINGEQYRLEYSGPEANPNPPTINFSMQVTKYDEVKEIVEGTLSGKMYKFNDPSMKAYSIQGKFRIKINKG